MAIETKFNLVDGVVHRDKPDSVVFSTIQSGWMQDLDSESLARLVHNSDTAIKNVIVTRRQDGKYPLVVVYVKYHNGKNLWSSMVERKAIEYMDLNNAWEVGVTIKDGKVTLH